MIQLPFATLPLLTLLGNNSVGIAPPWNNRPLLSCKTQLAFDLQSGWANIDAHIYVIFVEIEYANDYIDLFGIGGARVVDLVHLTHIVRLVLAMG
jgi:hypothetical protein